MKSLNTRHGYGVIDLSATAIANLIGATGTAVGAGASVASVVSQRKLQEQALRQQKLLALRQLRSAEESGQRDRILEARRALLQATSTPAFQYAAQRQRQTGILLAAGVIGITLITWLGTRKR